MCNHLIDDEFVLYVMIVNQGWVYDSCKPVYDMTVS